MVESMRILNYSLRLQQKGHDLSFDSENLVWHNDDSYSEIDNMCLKKQVISERTGLDIELFSQDNHSEYDTLRDLLNAD